MNGTSNISLQQAIQDVCFRQAEELLAASNDQGFAADNVVIFTIGEG